LATLLNVAPDEVAWTQNTSTSNRLAVSSLPWGAGDRLALSDHEHISTRMVKRRIEQITGRPATVIPTGDHGGFSPARFLDELDRMLTPDHRLLIVSHASCLDGRRLPIKEATAIAHARGVKVLVDGAQSVGQFPVDVADVAPDFYAGSVHKWLLGPAGIGYLHIARSQLPDYYPNLLPRPEPGQGNGAALTASGQTQIGTESMSMRVGAGWVMDAFMRIGLDVIEAHCRALTLRLRDGLKELRGFEVLGVYAWELSSGITSLRFPGWSEAQVHALIDRIWSDYRVVVKFQVDFAGIRISTASFNSAEEVDRLLEALRTLVPIM
jgi:selenocysteine lyase/cysteine desulfurase